MIKYDIDYQLFNGQVIVGLCNLWMLHDLVKVCICRHSLFHSLPWSGFLSCMAAVCSWLLCWLCSASQLLKVLKQKWEKVQKSHTFSENAVKTLLFNIKSTLLKTFKKNSNRHWPYYIVWTSGPSITSNNSITLVAKNLSLLYILMCTCVETIINNI